MAACPTPSEIFRELLYFFERGAAAAAVLDTVLDMIVDQFLLGGRDCLLDRMKLLRELEAGTAAFDHLDHIA